MIDAALKVPDPDETRDAGGSLAFGVVERIEMEAALIAGERSHKSIAEDFGVTVRTVERIAARMRAAGKRVRRFTEDD